MTKEIGRGKPTKGNIKQSSKLASIKSQTGMPKVCPSCQNPRWDKTPRKS